jgi:hypothetical protein
MKKINIGDTLYAHEVNRVEDNGRLKVVCELKTAEVIGICRMSFEGRWTDEEKSETLTYKVKIDGTEYITNQYLLENPDEDTNYSFFTSKKEAEDYVDSQMHFLYLDGSIDQDHYWIA